MLEAVSILKATDKETRKTVNSRSRIIKAQHSGHFVCGKIAKYT